ncbi:MAG: TMEM175 family protein [Acidobacteriota bacterium]|nr:TMEM175 family protein [Acidobacteriota bacterium]
MDKETARIEAFSDGVFAVAITLLVLEIKIPATSSTTLGSALLKQWPSYVAFAISFAFIGIMWMNHHRLFNHIRRSDDMLLVLNLLLLLGITVVPFSNGVLAAYLRTSQPHDRRIAALLYNGTYFLIAVLFNLLWRYASRDHRLLDKFADRTETSKLTRQYAFGPLWYAICFVLAWIGVPASLILNSILALFFALPPQVATRLTDLLTPAR